MEKMSFYYIVHFSNHAALFAISIGYRSYITIIKELSGNERRKGVTFSFLFQTGAKLAPKCM